MGERKAYRRLAARVILEAILESDIEWLIDPLNWYWFEIVGIGQPERMTIQQTLDNVPANFMKHLTGNKARRNTAGVQSHGKAI
jgi:hypothetical protein